MRNKTKPDQYRADSKKGFKINETFSCPSKLAHYRETMH